MSLRENLNGIFDGEQLQRLTWPIAWSGTVAQSKRDEEESELLAFVREANEAIDLTPDAYAVEVKDGEIISALTFPDE